MGLLCSSGHAWRTCSPPMISDSFLGNTPQRRKLAPLFSLLGSVAELGSIYLNPDQLLEHWIWLGRQKSKSLSLFVFYLDGCY